MAYTAYNYYPLTESFFNVEGSLVYQKDVRTKGIVGLHVFRWNPEKSKITIKTVGGSVVTFSGNSLVEGAVYWVSISEVMDIVGNAEDTQIWGIVGSPKL